MFEDPFGSKEHHSQCVPSQKRKKSKSPIKKDVKVSHESANEKLLVLRDENLHLKNRKQELEEEVKLIATKLKRQMAQLKRDKLVGSGGAPQSYARIEEELDKMIEENFTLQEEERKLMTAVKKLQKKKQESIASATTKVRTLSKKQQFQRSPSPIKQSTGLSRIDHSASEFILDAQNLRQNIEESNKKIIDLRTEIDLLRKANLGQIPSEDIIAQLRQKELQVAQQRARLEDLMDNLKVKEDIFKQNQAYQNNLVEELKNLNAEYLRLQKENRTFEEAQKQTEYLNTRIEEARIERDKLQREFDTITRQPFFKRETDQASFKRISELQAKVDEKERGIREAKENIIKQDEQLKHLQDEQRTIKMERETYSEEIERLRNQVDPSSLSLADIQKKIHDLDPSLFRQVMKDLKYDGEEPIWAKFDFMERLKLGPNNQPIDENDPKQLIKEVERLKVERRDLAAELEKVQNLLKMQVSIDKETAFIYQQEIEQIKAQIAADNRKIKDLSSLINARNQKLIAISKQTSSLHAGTTLTAEGLAKIDQELQKIQRVQKDDDILSEFSAVTNESEVAPQENVMDLIVSRAQFDQSKLSQILGNKEILPSAVQTFVTVDFFNHETKHSGLAEGFEPAFSTQFSFKNSIDDFYIQYLEKNTLILEFFITRAQNAIKIGSAKVVLSKLLENDNTFQAQEILYEGNQSSNGLGGYPIGKVLFKMRMRKPIDEALKWFQQKRALRLSRDPASIALTQPGANGSITKARSKIVTIQVLRCIDLKRPQQDNIHAIKTSDMQPFFYFQFYTFEGYYSPVMTGSSPHFDIRKQYEVELTEQFVEYMKTQLLQIDLIDESIDIIKGGTEAKDFIGRVRIPLKELFIGGGGSTNEEISDTFPVRDEKGEETGFMEVKMSCKDKDLYTGGIDDQRKGESFVLNKFAEREIVNKIAAKFADSIMESIDMIFDMLIEPGDYDRISKFRFKDYVLQITENIREQDIDIFLKTNSLIAGKDYIDLNDFRNIFEGAVNQSRKKRQEEQADREQNYVEAQKYFKQQPSLNTYGHTTSLNANTQLGYQQQEAATMTFTKNPMLDQSINQRMNETPGFENQQQKNQTQRPPLTEFLKDKVYLVINKFKDATKGESFANFEQFRFVMVDITASLDPSIEQEIGQFWSKHSFNNQFFYQEQLMQLYGQTNNAQVHQDTAQYQQFLKKTSDPQIIRIKEKIQQYLIKNDYSLEHLFGFIDKDKSQSVTIQELTSGLKDIITPDEALHLFMSIDQDQNKMLTYEELVNGCSKIYASYVLHKMRQAIQSGASSGLTIDKIFKSVDENGNGQMDIIEFNEVVTLCFKELKKHEIDTLFQHFDKRGLGAITKDEFQKGLNEPLALENRLHFYLNDFLTPLQTMIKHKKLTSSTIFDLFSSGRNSINIDTIKEIVRFYIKIDLSDEEILLLQSTLSSFYGAKIIQTGLEKGQFIDLMSKNFYVKTMDPGNSVIAKQTLARVRLSLKTMGGQKSLESIMQPYLDDPLPNSHQPQKVINIRSLKVFLMVVAARGLSAFEVENLVDYLDIDHNGFVGLLDFDKELSFSG